MTPRHRSAARMGLDPNIESVPKVVALFPPRPGDGDGATIGCLAVSMGQAHRAVPLTLALCLGAAVRIPGTIAAEMARPGRDGDPVVTIGHPSGSVDVGITMADGKVVAAELHRTARVLMSGDVFY